MLKAKSMNVTEQRLSVHAVMMQLIHASADMVCERLAAQHPETPVTTASVYNILSQLSDAGIYARRMSAGNKMFFDIFAYPHAHLYDVRNHEFHDMIDDELRALLEKHFRGRRFRGYHIDGIDVQLVCHPTRKNSKHFPK
ncbi:MAG: transcriptional repressor [Bacteroidales bacterium]|nr:transcriptional repressor [Bacteroidales bacterium]